MADFSRVRAMPRVKGPLALRKAIEHIAEVSAEQTPIEEGTLVRSQKVEVDPGTLTASIHYDGPYARYQHEKLELRHEHGNAKFLEIPMHTEKDTALQIMAREMRS